MQPRLSVNFERLRQDVETLATIGRRADLGLCRTAFSDDDDWAAREWLKERIREAGLGLYVDGAANILARHGWDGERPSVMTGSHLDTVPGGGHLDGALGVLAGVECLRCIKEQNLQTRFPLEAVAFTDEEGRFGGMLGSQAMCGRLTPESIYAARDLDGITLEAAMQERGLDVAQILRASRRSDSIQAFVELHIEQGPVLDGRGISVGVVEAITGLFKWNVTLLGRADHAGTTPMNMRKDALQGLAEFSGEIRVSSMRAAVRAASPRSGALRVIPAQPTSCLARSSSRSNAAIRARAPSAPWRRRFAAPCPASLDIET